jgi:serpin B
MARLSCVAALAVLQLAACGSDPVESGSGDAPVGVELKASALERERAPSAADVPELARGNQAFALDVLRTVAAAKPSDNVVLSPYSISTALAMTYAGARGTTATEMQQTLHFTLDQTRLHPAFNAVDQTLATRGQGKSGADGTPFRLNVNNSIWAQRDYPIESMFLDTLAVNYGAGVFLANFAQQPEPARAAINAWVSEKTEKLIPELLPTGSIRPDTRFVLTNTVYFNAAWKTKFENEYTSQAAFTKANGSASQVPMMHAGFGMPYAKGANYEAVALPYASDELEFIAVRPDAGAMDALQRAADGAWFTALLAGLTDSSVQLAFPKLDYDTQTSLKDALQALGMQAAFSGSADFSGLTSGSVMIDDVIHDAVIKVFEGGTIAAGATAVTVTETSALVFEHTLTFDRPFLYFIVDRPTGQILFLGRVLDPA